MLAHAQRYEERRSSPRIKVLRYSRKIPSPKRAVLNAFGIWCAMAMCAMLARPTAAASHTGLAPISPRLAGAEQGAAAAHGFPEEKESEISVEELNQFTYRIKNGLDKEAINELIELFKSHLRRFGNPWRTNYNCPGQKILMLPPSQMYRITQIFQPIIDKLSKKKHSFMKYFTENGFREAGFRRYHRPGPNPPPRGWSNFKNLKITTCGFLRYNDGGKCQHHTDVDVPWDNTLIGFELLGAEPGSGQFQTNLTGNNADWVAHQSGLGDGMVILRPVEHRVTPCKLPKTRLCEGYCKDCGATGRTTPFYEEDTDTFHNDKCGKCQGDWRLMHQPPKRRDYPYYKAHRGNWFKEMFDNCRGNRGLNNFDAELYAAQKADYYAAVEEQERQNRNRGKDEYELEKYLLKTARLKLTIGVEKCWSPATYDEWRSVSQPTQTSPGPVRGSDNISPTRLAPSSA